MEPHIQYVRKVITHVLQPSCSLYHAGPRGGPLHLPEHFISSQASLLLLMPPIVVTPPSKPGSIDKYDLTRFTSTSSSGGLLEAAVRDTESLLRITRGSIVEMAP